MLKGFEEDLAGLDLPEEVKSQLIEKANERASGLVSKNSELLEKLNANKSKAKEGQSAAEELAALKALQEQKELEDKQHYESALKLNSEKYTKQIDELTKQVSQFESEKRDTLINNGINDALDEIRVNPLHKEATASLFRQRAQLTDGKVMVGDKSLSDAISEWAESDSGKASRLAPENTGGNATGGQNVSGSGTKLTDAEKRAADINKRLGK